MSKEAVESRSNGAVSLLDLTSVKEDDPDAHLVPYEVWLDPVKIKGKIFANTSEGRREVILTKVSFKNHFIGYYTREGTPIVVRVPHLNPELIKESDSRTWGG